MNMFVAEIKKEIPPTVYNTKHRVTETYSLECCCLPDLLIILQDTIDKKDIPEENECLLCMLSNESHTYHRGCLIIRYSNNEF